MKQIEIGKAFGFGWESIKKDFWYFVGIAVVYMVLTSVPSSIYEHYTFDLLGLFIGPWLTAGITKTALTYYGGKKPPFETIFTQLRYFWRIFFSEILIGLIVVGGLILLIVPGIYWALKYQFVTNVIVDKDVSIGEAFKISGDLTKNVKLQILLFDLACAGVMILGGLALGVGVLVAYPIVLLAGIQVYKKLL